MGASHELSGDFEVDVIQASHECPVLVDFWAEWCGPCRVLGPTLEKLVEEADGRWRLVKVDTERNRDLAQRFRIRSIPAVKLFAQGEVVDEFVGALPEGQIRSWLDEALSRSGSGGNAHDEQLELASAMLLEDPAAALSLADAAEDSQALDLRMAIQTLGRLLDLVRRGELAELGIESPARARYVEGARALLAGKVEEALEHWIGLLARDRALDDDGARKAIVAAFRWLGEDDPRTQQYRRAFSAALF